MIDGSVVEAIATQGKVEVLVVVAGEVGKQITERL
jgi:hypothetical protein